jgi:hypothetical protein
VAVHPSHGYWQLPCQNLLWRRSLLPTTISLDAIGTSSIKAGNQVFTHLSKSYLTRIELTKQFRNFAASQVLNVSSAVFERFDSKEEAYYAFEHAVERKKIRNI